MSSIFYQNEVMKKKAMSMTHLTCVKAEHGLFAVKLSYLIRDGSKNMNLNINSVSVAGAEPVSCLMSYSQVKKLHPPRQVLSDEIKHGLDYSPCADAHSMQSSFIHHIPSPTF